MTQIMTITSVATRTTATAKDDKYDYRIDYSISNLGKALDSLTITVTDNTDNHAYVATMVLNNNNDDRTITSKVGSDSVALNTMFDSIISEVKSTLVV